MKAGLGALALVVLLSGCAAQRQPSPATAPTTSTTTASMPPAGSPPPSTSTSMQSTPSTASVLPLEGKMIVIDPGHNGMNWAHPDEINQPVDIGNGTKPCNTTGTATSDGYTEAQFTWEVAQLTRSRLEEAGAEVVLTRHDNDGWGPCITERAAIANRAEADAAVSIHADGGPEDGRGFHVIYPAEIPGLTDDVAEESLRLAQALHGSYRSTGIPPADYIGERGYAERDDLGGLNLSAVPVVFLEAGNMRNLADAQLLRDPAFHAQVAEAIVEAMIRFLTNPPTEG